MEKKYKFIVSGNIEAEDSVEAMDTIVGVVSSVVSGKTYITVYTNKGDMVSEIV